MEMNPDQGVIMLASRPVGYESPATRRERYAQTRQRLSVPWAVDGMLVYVDEVEAHCQRAQKGGATMLSPIEDAPYGRLYRAEDLDGHR